MPGSPEEQHPILAGRESECHLALSAVLAAQRGTGQAVIFLGPRGIGKSALLEEIGHRIEGLFPDSVICRARFSASCPPVEVLSGWISRLAAVALGDWLPANAKPAPLEAIIGQASRRGETALQDLLEEAKAAGAEGRAAGLVEALSEAARYAGRRSRRAIVFLADDLHGLGAADSAVAEPLAEFILHADFPWIAAALPEAREALRGGLRAAFRSAPMAPLDWPEAAKALEARVARRGREIDPRLARALGACLQGHGALTDSFARELAFCVDPEPRLETLVRLLIGSLEHGAFAVGLASEFQALYPNSSQRREALEALCRLNAECESRSIPRRAGLEPAILTERAGALRALGMLDWQDEALVASPLWAVRQLTALWRDQSSGGLDASGSRFLRAAETLRRARTSAAGAEGALDGRTLAACLEVLSGGELDERHFTVLPESLAPARRLRLPSAVFVEPLRTVPALGSVSQWPPPWLALAGMLGLVHVSDEPQAAGEAVFWVLAAFSPPVAVTAEDVVQVRRLAELASHQTAGMKVSGVWIVGGSFGSDAERAAEEHGVALSTWGAWRALNALPAPTGAQLEAEALSVVDPSGRGFLLELRGDSTLDAADAAETLAEKGGFAPRERRDIHEAVRLGCENALRRVAGTDARVRIRARMEEQWIVIAVEHEIPRWRARAGVNGASAGAGEMDWDLAPLRSRVDQAMAEGLPWGWRLTLRKRLIPQAHLGQASEF